MIYLYVSLYFLIGLSLASYFYAKFYKNEEADSSFDLFVVGIVFLWGIVVLLRIILLPAEVSLFIIKNLSPLIKNHFKL